METMISHFLSLDKIEHTWLFNLGKKYPICLLITTEYKRFKKVVKYL